MAQQRFFVNFVPDTRPQQRPSWRFNGRSCGRYCLATAWVGRNFCPFERAKRPFQSMSESIWRQDSFFVVTRGRAADESNSIGEPRPLGCVARVYSRGIRPAQRRGANELAKSVRLSESWIWRAFLFESAPGGHTIFAKRFVSPTMKSGVSSFPHWRSGRLASATIQRRKRANTVEKLASRTFFACLPFSFTQKRLVNGFWTSSTLRARPVRLSFIEILKRAFF